MTSQSHNDTVTVTLAVEGHSLSVVEISGAEGLCELFEFELKISSNETALPIAGLVSKAAALTIAQGEKSRTLHGILSRMKQGRTSATEALYRATLVPAVWALGQRTDSRIFQKTDVKSVIAEVLAAHGFAASDYVLPSTTFTTRDTITQYRETDWAFLCRLMEEEGIYYYFEHGDSGATLVMTDDVSVHETLPFGSLEYVETSGALQGDAERVTSFEYTSAVATAQVTTWAVSLKTPSTTTVTSVNAAGTTYDEVFDYQPKQSAETQLDALQAATAIVEGEASTVRIAPGGTFTLENHPRADFDAAYLVTRVVHDSTVSSASSYSTTFTCIPKSTKYRPTQKTPKPSIVGPQAATVVGQSGAEITADKYGRVLVRMHWDRSTSNTIDSSVPASYEVWVHVAQLSGGGGAMFLPRAGWHVLVEFIGGDPDKPVITGRFYSDQIQPPYALPENVAKSTIRSKIYGKDDEYSELTFDDASAKKQVYLRAQRSLLVDVGTETEASVFREVNVHGDDETTIDADQTLSVGGQRAVSIGSALAADFADAAHDVTVTGDEELAVSGDQTIAVAGRRALVVGGTADQAFMPTATSSTTVIGSRAAKVSGWETVIVGSARQHDIGPDVSSASYSTASTVDIVNIRGTQEQTIYGSQSVSVGVDQTTYVKGNASQTVEGNLTQTVYGTLTTNINAHNTNVTGALKITAAGELRMESTGDATKIGGTTIYLSADSDIEIRSATSISLVIGSLTDNSSTSRKLILDEDGIYVTNGKVKQKLSGSTVRFNC